VGNHTSVLAGDWLYMQPSRSRCGAEFRVLDILIGLTQMMVEGELLQLERIAASTFRGRLHGAVHRKNGGPVLGLRAAGSAGGRRDSSAEDKLGD